MVAASWAVTFFGIGPHEFDDQRDSKPGSRSAIYRKSYGYRMFQDRAMRRRDLAKRCQVEHDRERHRKYRNHNQRKRANENVWSVQRKDLETAGCTQESGRQCYHEITDTQPVPKGDKLIIFVARSAGANR